MLSKIDEKIDGLQITTENLAKKLDSVSDQSCSFASSAPVHVNVPKLDLKLKTEENEFQLKFAGMPENDIKYPIEKKLKETNTLRAIRQKQAAQLKYRSVVALVNVTKTKRALS